MTTRNTITQRIREMVSQPADVDPADELTELRQVAPGAEVSGSILPEHLAFPEGMGPEWVPLLDVMREEMAGGVARVVRELIAEGRPEPLIGFAEATADAGGFATVRFAYVPLATIWEINNVFVRHGEGGSENVTISLEPGGQIDALAVPTVVGASVAWSGPLYLRSGVRIVVGGSGLTQGNDLEVAITGRIHSTRDN